MTMVYVLLFLTGLLGNLAVCLVIVRNRSMHTATNYYLFSLAMADLVILILGLPNELVSAMLISCSRPVLASLLAALLLAALLEAVYAH